MNKKNKILLCFSAIISISLICVGLYVCKFSLTTLKVNIPKSPLSFDKKVVFSSSSALAIGLRTDIDSDTTSYRTLLINSKDNHCSLLKQVPYILVLNDRGLFKLEPIRFDFGETMDYLQYIAVHKNMESYSPSFMEYNQDTFSSKLLYVNDDLAALENYRVISGDNCKIINEVALVKLEDIPRYRNSNVKVNIKEILPEASALIDASVKNNEDGIKNTTDGSCWTVIRENGLWCPKLSETFEYYNSYVDYKLKSLPVKSNEKFNPICHIKMEQVKKLFPKAMDFVLSKDSKALVVFFPETIKVYPLNEYKVGTESLSIALNPNEKMIMYKGLDEKALEEMKSAQ